MPLSRYTKSPVLAFGTQQGTSTAVATLRRALREGALTTSTTVVRGAERLDTMAGVIYGDARYWWILAAASDIGWGLQIPPGTVINIPQLADVLRIVG